MIYDVIIIGGGPAGLAAAAKLKHKNVLLLEKNESLGQKLLLSGSGQCNITHGGEIKNFVDHYGRHGKFLRQVLFNYTNDDLLSDFNQYGLKFVDNGKGKIFPEAMNSQVVLDVMIQMIRDNSVQVKTKEAAESVVRCEDGFRVKTPKGGYVAKSLVIATGGKTYQNTGSTGDGYKFAKAMGIDVATPREALTPIVCKDFRLSDLMGLSFVEKEITLWREGKKKAVYRGDLLITHKGLSGPVILNNSRDFQVGDSMQINFINDVREALDLWLLDRIKAHPKKKIKTLISELDLPIRLLEGLLKISGIDREVKAAELKKDARKALAKNLCACEFTIKTFGGDHIAMVTAGGVELAEINKKTMGTNKIENLYFIGEVIDIDGDTGGYNIQAAYAMGVMCAQSILRNHVNFR